MTQQFELYDMLARLDYDILVDNKIICRTITNLSKNNTEILYAIILHHHVLTTGIIPESPPYSATIFPGGKGIKALWINLPAQLQKIIVYFIDNNKET